MKRLAQLAAVWILATQFAVAQTLLISPLEVSPLETTVEQISYVEVDSAAFEAFVSSAIRGDNGKTILVGEMPVTAKRTAVRLTIKNQDNNWIEVHDKANPFPPLILTAFAPGQYLIHGSPGQTFYVSVRSNSQPVWLTITILPRGPPDEPPPDDDELAAALLALEKTSRDEAAKLGDKIGAGIFQQAFRDGITAATGQTDLKAAIKIVGDIRRKAAASRDIPVNWESWRTACDAAMGKINPTTVADYLRCVKALADGLQ